MKKAYTRILIFVAAIIIGVGFVSVFASRWPAVVLLYIVWIIGWLAWLIKWHSKAFVYQCNFCRAIFEVSPMGDALSPHMMDTKLLRCPKCGHSDWFKGMEREGVKTEILPVGYRGSIKIEVDRTLYWQIALVLSVYLILWLHTISYYLKLPDFIPMKSNRLITMQNKVNLLLLPIVAGIFPLIELFICRHAIKEGLKSKIYWFITALFLLILLLFCGIQYYLIDFALNH